MIAAAPLAASTASGVRWSAASAAISRSTTGLRAATAQARAVPQACSGLSVEVPMVEPRLSLMSLAYSGRAALTASRPMSGPGAGEQRVGVEGGAALVPVARAQLVGLQGVEHPQHLGDVPADRAGGHHGELDLVVRVDDEGGALGDAVLAEHAEAAVSSRLMSPSIGKGSSRRSGWSLRQA